MKLMQIPLALALALALGTLVSGCAQEQQPAADAVADAAAVAVAADTHAADTHDAGNADAVARAGGNDFPAPANHVPWTPDAPLVEGMSRVRTALAGLEAPSHPDDATVAARAADIDAAVAYMFANCKLDTDPDIALHAVLARLMAGTKALKANPSDGSPVADMHAAMHNYGQLFADPNNKGAAP
jgi:hypothetical protein